MPSSSSQSKVPSKLRSSSTASFLERERDRSSTPGSQSSVGTPIASTSSAISARSVAGTGPPKRGRPKGSKTGTGRGALVAQQKRPSPPRPLLPPPPPPPPAPAVRIEQDYLVGRFQCYIHHCLYLLINQWYQTSKETRLGRRPTQTADRHFFRSCHLLRVRTLPIYCCSHMDQSSHAVCHVYESKVMIPY